jgi:argininosuccinate lyase
LIDRGTENRHLILTIVLVVQLRLVMTDTGGTGRIDRKLTAAARKILFARKLDDHIDEEMPFICRIDCAHVLMLAECQIVSSEKAQKLLRALQKLVGQQFAPLKARPSERGLFLLYEHYLIETEGSAVGGVLQTARSRNDLGATLLRLRLRRPCRELINAALRLQAVLVKRAHAYARVVMPAYTHGQPAEPITYGHYLAGLAQAIRRDIDGLLESIKEIDTCPLGAAAIAGTSLPIDTERTASLLGFMQCSANSIDAVASRDVVLRLLAAMAIYATTLSRIATDLLQWLTAEFQFLQAPDEIVGSSSAMPQKRNPFLLEHVQGRTSTALGAFTQALAATRNTAFSNSIAVGTESVRTVWDAVQDTTDATTLLRLVLFHAKPRPERMLQRAAESFTNATALATRMSVESAMDFRSAHHQIGRAVKDAMARGMKSLLELVQKDPSALPVSFEGMDPASCVDRNRYGGGPAPESNAAQLAQLRRNWIDQHRRILDQAGRWTAAQNKLEQEVRRFVEF